MPAKKYVRKRLFVDPKLQGAIALRVVLYWLFCLSAIALLMYCYRTILGRWQLWTPADDLGLFCRCAAFCTLSFLPLAVIDVVRLSNRFAGPMLRLQRAMQELGRGEHVEPVRFRDGDFWQGLAVDFNAVVARVQGQAGSGQPEPPPASTRDETMQPTCVG